MNTITNSVKRLAPHTLRHFCRRLQSKIQSRSLLSYFRPRRMLGAIARRFYPTTRIVFSSLAPISFFLSNPFALRDWFFLLGGIFVYLKTGRTPDKSFHAMRHLFCKTNGRSNNLLHFFVRTFRKPYQLPEARGAIGNLTREEVSSIANEIRVNGYYIFPRMLSTDICERLTHFASTTPCAPWPPPVPDAPPVIYDHRCPQAPTYWMSKQNIVTHPDVQDFISDPAVLAISQAYLDCQPVLSTLGLWWSNSLLQEPSVASAQLYHFDLEHIKFLRFFIYLTDVDSENGPHCFVQYSHRQSSQTSKLLKSSHEIVLKHGHNRLPDDVITRYYPPGGILEFTGRRGMVIAEDTRGFHKGKQPLRGERLMFEMEFSNSLFGSSTPELRTNFTPHLQEMARKYPRTYSMLIKQESPR